MNQAQSEVLAPLVLVVDDDETARVLTEIVLTNAVFRVIQAENGKEALDLFRFQRPDIVLLDVGMPVMDGFDACRELRRLPGGESIPVLMLTGHDDIASINRAYEVGATDFLAKSSNLEIIAHRVRYMLRAARAFSELEKNREGLASAQRMARIGGWEWHADSDRFLVSAEVCEMFGLTANAPEATSERFMSRVHNDDREGVREAVVAALRGIRPYDVQHRLQMLDGTERHVHAKAEVSFGADGRAQIMRGTIQDVTERWLAEQKIHSLAYYDSLTGLPNRLMFRDQLERAIARCLREAQQLAVMFLDLDKFKRVNDTLGHLVGDDVLREFARKVGDCLRREDLLVRYGGEEFCVLLPGADAGTALTLADRIRSTIDNTHMNTRAGPVHITTSVGICGDDAKVIDSLDSLLSCADGALYLAKAAGRNQVISSLFKAAGPPLTEAASRQL